MGASRRTAVAFLAGALLLLLARAAEATPTPLPGNHADEIARHARELGHDDVEIRDAAERHLLEIGRTDPVSVLLDLPDDAEDPEIRSRVRIIRDALTDEFWRWECLLAETDSPRLLRMTGHEKPDLRRAALRHLGLRGEAVNRPAIERAVLDEDTDVAEAARCALQLMDPAMFEHLHAAEEPSRRLDFVLAVRTRRDTRQISRLVNLALDPTPSVRAIAEETLHAFGADEAGHALCEAAAHKLGNPDAATRRNAVQLIARWKPEGGRASVTPLLADPHPTVRRAAVEALVALNGPAAGEAITPLLADASPMVQSAASEAIARLERPRTGRDPE